MADATNKQTTDAQPAVLVAIELSRASWLLAVYDPTTDKISRRRVAGGDAAGLIALIGEARRRAEQRADGPVGAECVFEAGYDGFWLERHLRVKGIGCRVMDPASLKVDRRARRVKTDRVDAESLLRALQAWRRGDRHACRFRSGAGRGRGGCAAPTPRAQPPQEGTGRSRQPNQRAARLAWRT